MKKIFLLSLISGCSLSVMAQQTLGSMVNENAPKRGEESVLEPKAPIKTNLKHLAKTTATPFATENFSSGTANTLPTGWSVGSVGVPTNASWKWRQTSCVGSFNIGVINSTTAANGWMVYDSDSIGKLPGTNPIFEGWLESPSYNCLTHPTVKVTFQQHFRRFQDTCWLEASNDNGASWTRWEIKPNSILTSNSNLPTNPYTSWVNISSVAGSQANVKIRFRYKNIYTQGGLHGTFNWLVDDVELSELDPVELGLDNASAVMNAENSFTTFSSIPLQLLDSITPVVTISNNGYLAPANININAKVYNGASQIYSQTNNLTSLAAGVQDSLLVFTPLLLTAKGSYSMVFDVNQAGDADVSNNTDTSMFTISDSIYHRIGGAATTSYYIHRAPGSTSVERSFSIGNTFRIPTGKSDTITSVFAAFQSTTTPGSVLVANIFKFISPNWEWQASCAEKALAASDISTPGNPVFTRFKIEPSQNPVIMDEGQWAVVFAGKNIPTSSTVLILSGPETSPPVLNYLHGVSDTSFNDGIAGFGGPANLPSRISGSPFIRVHFGDHKTVSVNDVNSLTITGEAYPNPAKNQVEITFTTSVKAEVTISISNTLGQSVKSMNLGSYNANQVGKANFNVSDLSNGVYFYTLEANGQRFTKRFVVAH